jgi:uncharacterized protein YbjT (DUF2867 family)
MIAVAGATGHTGKAVADALLQLGRPVRVIVRDPVKGETWKARGAEVAVASLGDADALSRALSGADSAYLLIPPAYGAPDALAAQRVVVNAVAEAVGRSQLRHVVLLSSIGSQHATGVGPIRTLHAAERALAATGHSTTALRASYFVENWAGVLGAVAGQGILPSFLPLDQPIEMAATSDIGGVAADLLLGPAPAGFKAVEMGGHAPLSPRELAVSLGQMLGRHIEPILVPLDQVVPTFTGLGFSESAATLMREMYEGFGSGRVGYEDPAAPHVRGTLTPVDVLGPTLARA